MPVSSLSQIAIVFSRIRESHSCFKVMIKYEKYLKKLIKELKKLIKNIDLTVLLLPISLKIHNTKYCVIINNLLKILFKHNCFSVYLFLG